ncbi:uncharacterized protein LOC131670713 [Phymastichus coffea]|uniref:uncharacterized protein LOC131670713 n=1 Tax=Phymastichus coffea TaxID=108790 RepID=UPI00273BB181|nr:uncharacterized protein LOC131670713 [Phymastichus coffea]
MKLRKVALKHFTLKPKPPNQKLESYGCNYCTQVYVCHTTRMIDHLLECKGCPPHVVTLLKEHQQKQGRKSKKRKLITNTSKSAAANSISSESCLDSENENNSTDSTAVPKKKIGAPISEFFDNMTKSEQEICSNLLAKAIYTGGVSFIFLENEYFLEFLSRLRPKFICPTRHQISGPLLDKIHDEVQVKVNKKIENASSLTIQSDSYSTTTNEGIINFIVNTPDPVLYKHIETKNASQTGEYLCDALSSVIDEVSAEKTLAAITDNASYCRRAWKLLELRYALEQIFGYGCFAHILNLFCQDTIQTPSTKSILDEAVLIVKSIKHSHILGAALKDIQNSSNGEEGARRVTKTLKLPGKTRWGSSLEYLESVNDNCFNLKQLAISKYSDRLKIEGDQSMFYEVVNVFEDLKSVLNKELFDTSLSIFNYDEAQKLSDCLQSHATMVLTPLHYAANILNPSSRGKHLTPENFSVGQDMILKLSRKFQVSEQNLLVELSQYTAETGFWSSESGRKTSRLVNPDEWWKGICSCTSLSKIAVPIMNLPCSSAATERSFSTYGWIHNAKRNRFKVGRASKYDEENADEEELSDDQNDFPVVDDNEYRVSSEDSILETYSSLHSLPSNLQSLPEGTYAVQNDSTLTYNNG